MEGRIHIINFAMKKEKIVWSVARKNISQKKQIRSKGNRQQAQ